jgi:6-hydroxytryprostatin B O-methyltransferase
MDHLIETTPKGAVPPLQAYAKAINLAVETITSYLTTEGVPQPSFDPKAPSVTIPSTAPLAVQDARQQLIASAAAIQKLATEPAEFLPNLAVHVREVSSFHPSRCEKEVLIS